MSNSAQHTPPKGSVPNETFQTVGKAVVLGMIACSAGFTLYTRRTSQMIRQLDQITKNKAKRMPAPRIGPHTREEWDKIRPRFEKGDMF
mmetsp:Transcript_15926/g.44034  ORF Transcript_15926/g.44034 Transcript_15926/m.44034 type:complete len:89 (-) Transcript_15926:1428-1694(-)